MNGSHRDVFFYGLFMDAGVLRDAGVEASHPRPGYLPGFELQIGQRAYLMRKDDARAYGLVYRLEQAELDRLYAQPGLQDYRPMELQATLMAGGTVRALCYDLPDDVEQGEEDREYARKLNDVLAVHGLPTFR